VLCLYGYDAHGNVTFLADATGAVTDTYDYDAFGDIMAISGSTPNTRLFAGEEVDPDLGLINLRARQYLPAKGRFFAIDQAIGDPLVPVSFNRYLYANADPVNGRDPLGLATAAEGGIFIGGIAAKEIIMTAGKGVLIGGGAAVAGHAVACEALGRASELTSLLSEDQGPLLSLSATLGCGKWTCYCRCGIRGNDLAPGVPGYVTGRGRGVTEAAAAISCQKAAKENFSNAPWNPGSGSVGTKHCHTIACYRD
jgi:RHS repeat-associated protein